jgi:hypothetical protein
VTGEPDQAVRQGRFARGAFQAGRVPAGPRRNRWHRPRALAGDEVVVAHRLVRDRELKDSVEHETPRLREVRRLKRNTNSSK